MALPSSLKKLKVASLSMTPLSAFKDTNLNKQKIMENIYKFRYASIRA